LHHQQGLNSIFDAGLKTKTIITGNQCIAQTKNTHVDERGHLISAFTDDASVDMILETISRVEIFDLKRQYAHKLIITFQTHIPEGHFLRGCGFKSTMIGPALENAVATHGSEQGIMAGIKQHGFIWSPFYTQEGVLMNR
jgi:hypothetical protein